MQIYLQYKKGIATNKISHRNITSCFQNFSRPLSDSRSEETNSNIIQRQKKGYNYTSLLVRKVYAFRNLQNALAYSDMLSFQASIVIQKKVSGQSFIFLCFQRGERDTKSA